MVSLKFQTPNPKSQKNSKHQIQMTKTQEISHFQSGGNKGEEENGEGKHFSILVSEKDEGKRIDQFLSDAGLNLSRSQAKKLIETGTILLNQKPTKPSAHLKMGDVVTGTLPQPIPLSLSPEPIPITILYEDPSIIVIDKPAGMVVHPAAGNPKGTLVNALLHHCKDLTGINGVLRPGIVHRLDKDTSGVMVVAKNDEAYQQLTRQFKNRTVEKIYLAVVYGRFNKEEGVIHSPIGRHPSERKRMSTKTKKGRTAITRWKVIERFGDFSLLEIFPRTGRTHQIRVHLSSIGHPLLGDPLYGRKGRPGSIHDNGLKEYVKRINRQALHAYQLAFNHPKTGERVQFVSPISHDMKELLEWLRSEKGERTTSSLS
jgi:23S rRNA pseudouridine1911/1915/1917 synthase